ncbi:MAG TPA: acyl carrier protein [Gemmatimonadaceae bacterium]|nr:acyl carrier protein [Gemmatimonadaceae bacterium]
MTRDQIRATLLEALSRIAPEVGAADIDPAANLRDQIDIDSMDFLNFMILLRQTLGVDVPETDYPTLRTLDACVDYFAAKQAAPAAPAAR